MAAWRIGPRYHSYFAHLHPSLSSSPSPHPRPYPRPCSCPYPEHCLRGCPSCPVVAATRSTIFRPARFLTRSAGRPRSRSLSGFRATPAQRPRRPKRPLLGSRAKGQNSCRGCCCRRQPSLPPPLAVELAAVAGAVPAAALPALPGRRRALLGWGDLGTRLSLHIQGFPYVNNLLKGFIWGLAPPRPDPWGLRREVAPSLATVIPKICPTRPLSQASGARGPPNSWGQCCTAQEDCLRKGVGVLRREGSLAWVSATRQSHQCRR